MGTRASDEEDVWGEMKEVTKMETSGCEVCVWGGGVITRSWCEPGSSRGQGTGRPAVGCLRSIPSSLLRLVPCISKDGKMRLIHLSWVWPGHRNI